MKWLAAGAATLAFVVASTAARAERLCVIEARFPTEVHDGFDGQVIGALPPGMPVVATDQIAFDEMGRAWVAVVSFEIVAGWIADADLRCR